VAPLLEQHKNTKRSEDYVTKRLSEKKSLQVTPRSLKNLHTILSPVNVTNKIHAKSDISSLRCFTKFLNSLKRDISDFSVVVLVLLRHLYECCENGNK